LHSDRTSSECDGHDDPFHGDYGLSSDLLFFQSLTRWS
jgi:hypothetical protein